MLSSITCAQAERQIAERGGMMKRLFAFLFSLSLLLSFFPAQKTVHAAEVLELNIMNWEDYIDAGDEEEQTKPVVDEFIEYYEQKYGNYFYALFTALFFLCHLPSPFFLSLYIYGYFPKYSLSLTLPKICLY